MQLRYRDQFRRVKYDSQLGYWDRIPTMAAKYAVLYVTLTAPVRAYRKGNCFGRPLRRPTIASPQSCRHDLGCAAGLFYLYIAVPPCLDKGVKPTCPA
jgi:hypothetical protein